MFRNVQSCAHSYIIKLRMINELAISVYPTCSLISSFDKSKNIWESISGLLQSSSRDGSNFIFASLSSSSVKDSWKTNAAISEKHSIFATLLFFSNPVYDWPLENEGSDDGHNCGIFSISLALSRKKGPHEHASRYILMLVSTFLFRRSLPTIGVIISLFLSRQT